MYEKYFKGKNAVITGAASGIGQEFSIQLAKIGTNLVISDINLEGLEEVKKQVDHYNIKVITQKCNVTKKSDIRKLVDVSISSVNDIHFLFSNAGIATGGQFEYFTLDQWKKTMNVNLWGTLSIIREFIPKMLEQGFGHIIVTSSITAIIGTGSLIPYTTTKFANAGLCEALYGEYNDKGIEISLLCPFPLKTNLIDNANIGIPPDLLNRYNPEIFQKGMVIGKKYYWDKFTKEGYELNRAIKLYLKQIAKKKLYICERKSARFLFFIKGLYPKLYKKIVRKVGSEHCRLLDESINVSINAVEDLLR